MSKEFKISPNDFQDIWDGHKTYHYVDEHKKNYRPYDVLVFREFKKGKYTGRELNTNVKHIGTILGFPRFTLLGLMVYQWIDPKNPDVKKKSVIG